METGTQELANTDHNVTAVARSTGMCRERTATGSTVSATSTARLAEPELAGPRGEWQRRRRSREREISKRNGRSGSGGHRVYYLARKHRGRSLTQQLTLLI